MKVVSRYVREQKRYTKNDLKSKFSFDEDGVEKFIKNLKAYGVLKSVKNTDDQLEMSDLVDDDVEITDETAESGDCLYVFTYVGVITCGSRVIKVYPKYLLSKKDDNVLDEMKQVVKVLERYSRSEEQIINVFNGDGENRSFNILAVILFLINDYYEYGIYTNSEDIIEVNGEGEILWGKTIDESFAMIEDNRPYYMELYTEKSVEDDMDYFKRLHECVLTECSRQLRDAQLDALFDMDVIELSEETLADFGDKEYVLERIIKELNLQFNTHRQILLKTLYAYVSQDRKMLDENDGISMFGTTAYHAVWEKACAEVFDNKLNTTLAQLKMTVPLAEKYNSKTIKRQKLIDIIEKPIWQGEDTEAKAADTLIPDLISIPFGPAPHPLQSPDDDSMDCNGNYREASFFSRFYPEKVIQVTGNTYWSRLEDAESDMYILPCVINMDDNCVEGQACYEIYLVAPDKSVVPLCNTIMACDLIKSAVKDLYMQIEVLASHVNIDNKARSVIDAYLNKDKKVLSKTFKVPEPSSDDFMTDIDLPFK